MRIFLCSTINIWFFGTKPLTEKAEFGTALVGLAIFGFVIAIAQDVKELFRK